MDAHAGLEWILDVEGVAPERLAGAGGRAALEGLFADLVEALALQPVAPPVWHVFAGRDGTPGAGGVTGLVALSESHLAAHGYPESGYLSLNLYTCRPRPAPDWPALLRARLGDCSVRARSVRRGRSAASAEEARP